MWLLVHFSQLQAPRPRLLDYIIHPDLATLVSRQSTRHDGSSQHRIVTPRTTSAPSIRSRCSQRAPWDGLKDSTFSSQSPTPARPGTLLLVARTRRVESFVKRSPLQRAKTESSSYIFNRLPRFNCQHALLSCRKAVAQWSDCCWTIPFHPVLRCSAVPLSAFCQVFLCNAWHYLQALFSSI